MEFKKKRIAGKWPMKNQMMLYDILNDTLNLLKANSNIRQKDMAIKLQVSEATIKRNIKISKFPKSNI